MILICGVESALREDALSAVRKAAFGDSDPGLSCVVLHGPANRSEGEALTPAAFLDEACTSSMFADPGELKVVIVRQADIFLNDREYREIVERNLEKIPESAVLVLEVADIGRAKTTRLVKLLQEQNALVSCDSLSGRFDDNSELELEVQKRAQSKGLQLAPDALAALMERSCRNLGVLQEELDKLVLALRPAEKDGAAGAISVSKEDVLEFCASTRTFSAFNFVDAVVERDARRALEVLGAVFERGIGDSDKPGKVVTQEGSIAMLLLGALTWRLSQLQDVQAALDAGQREWDVFGAFKIFGARQDGMRRTLKKHSSASLRRCLEALFRANLDLRRGGNQPLNVLEQLAWAIIKS